MYTLYTYIYNSTISAYMPVDHKPLCYLTATGLSPTEGHTVRIAF